MAEDPLVEVVRRLRIVERYVEETRRLDHYTSPIGDYLHLPELRGFWPMSSSDENFAIRDLSDQGRTLTQTGGVGRGVQNNVIPYATFDGSTQHLARADEAGLDLTTSMAFGGWFWLNAVASTQSLISKYNPTGNQRAYEINFLSTGSFRVTISSDGTAGTTADSSGITISVNKWYFLAARFVPSTELSLYVNGQRYTNTTSIPAAIFNSSSDFRLAARGDGTNRLNGRAALCFVCATTPGHELIGQLFQRTRGMFGT